MQPQILLADDHSMIRKGLKLLLQLHLGFTQVSEVVSCNELMKELSKKKYTHLVLDIILSDGSTLEILPNIQRLYPELRIMVFSMQPAEVYGKALRQYGIDHYLPKTTPEEDTIRLLHRFLLNEQATRDNFEYRYPNNPFSALAPRELEKRDRRNAQRQNEHCLYRQEPHLRENHDHKPQRINRIGYLV
jgi:two-component system, NarL family, invasion response regulator UvrY